MRETDFEGKITEKRQNCDPLHNSSRRRESPLLVKQRNKEGLRPPVAQMAWEDADKVSFTGLQYSNRQAWARAAESLHRPTPTRGKKRN
jgi:hypothetical protein